MMGFQAAGAAPLVIGRPVQEPRTLATAIRIGNPASWDGAVRARDESGGAIEKVTDEEIVEAYRLVASLEGVFAEPASAASVAGLIQVWSERRVPLEGTVVCTLTGHGLKDPERAIETADKPVMVEPTFDAVAREVES
jgi:threonine synthase